VEDYLEEYLLTTRREGTKERQIKPGDAGAGRRRRGCLGIGLFATMSSARLHVVDCAGARSIDWAGLVLGLLRLIAGGRCFHRALARLLIFEAALTDSAAEPYDEWEVRCETVANSTD
jgi:hypothetical protein